MNTFKNHARKRRSLASAAGLLACTALLATPQAYAVSGYVSSFINHYSPGPTVEAAARNCSLCHTSPPTRNPYGRDVQGGGSIVTRLVAAEPRNSDGDSDGAGNACDNITEITADTLPGSAASTPASCGAAAAPNIQVSPNALGFGNVTEGTTQTLAATVQNTGNADLTVSNLTVSGSGDFALGAAAPSTPFTVAPGGSASIPVSYSPAGAGGDTGVLTIASDDADTPSVSVSLSGTGVPVALGCRIEAQPLALAFGQVTVGVSGTRSTTVTNIGDADCSVSLSLAGSPDFAVGSAMAFNLASQGSSAVSVTYTPDAPGNDSGTLEIASNDPASPVTVSLTGSGAGIVQQPEGKMLYDAHCLSCHGDPGQGNGPVEDVAGDDAEDIAEAIDEVRAMRDLNFLTPEEIQAIADYLSQFEPRDNDEEDNDADEGNGDEEDNDADEGNGDEGGNQGDAGDDEDDEHHADRRDRHRDRGDRQRRRHRDHHDDD